MKINEKNLCVFASNPPYDLEGFLNKKGEVNKSFQKRYFVLKGNLLFYFEKKGDKEPLGLIIVEGCTIELSAESDQYCFEIAFNGNRTYVLSAESQDTMEKWMKALTCAGYEYKKLMVAELQRQLEELEGTRNKMLSESTNEVISTPRPPPRRQNPFDRPAPPPPLRVANGNGSNTTNSTFINGQFGSTSQRNDNNYNANNNMPAAQQQRYDSSPIPPPRVRPSAIGSKSEFYLQQPIELQSQQQQQQQQQRSHHKQSAEKTVFNPSHPPSHSTTTIKQHLPLDIRSPSSDQFQQLHEKFRKLVMQDILEYREMHDLKTKPLIDI